MFYVDVITVVNGNVNPDASTERIGKLCYSTPAHFNYSYILWCGTFG